MLVPHLCIIGPKHGESHDQDDRDNHLPEIVWVKADGKRFRHHHEQSRQNVLDGHILALFDFCHVGGFRTDVDND